MESSRNILIIEPYYGGSHRAFLTGMTEHIAADYKFLTLPARKWKMRMQLSAPWFVKKIKEMGVEKRWFDTVLCSTFVDVGLLRALLSQVDGWNPDVRYCTYFHENQFVYPGQVKDKSIFQFTALNFTTALASDRLAFNSRYNLTTFLHNSRKFVKKAADMYLQDTVDDIERKSIVLHPGMEYSLIDLAISDRKNSPPVIVWNHRWEHDKNPEEFFDVLFKLHGKGLGFGLVVLGESFREWPDCFARAKELLKDKIIHFGFADSKEEYARLLKHGDIVVSTSVHEFFGISVIEAVRAGCTPLLPDRLSYPELFPAKYRYGEDELESRLESLLKNYEPMSEVNVKKLTDHFGWSQLAGKYREWLLE